MYPCNLSAHPCRSFSTGTKMQCVCRQSTRKKDEEVETAQAVARWPCATEGAGVSELGQGRRRRPKKFVSHECVDAALFVRAGPATRTMQAMQAVRPTPKHAPSTGPCQLQYQSKAMRYVMRSRRRRIGPRSGRLHSLVLGAGPRTRRRTFQWASRASGSHDPGR